MIVDVYAKALYNLATDLEEWLLDLEALSALFRPKLLNLFSSPLLSWTQKNLILTRALKGKLPFELLNFILILIKKKRFAYFHEIVQAYKAKVYDKLGKIEGIIITPYAIDEETKKSLEDHWTKLLDKKVIMKEEVDASLIGGGILKFKDKRVDFSLHGKLMRLKRNMRQP